MSGDIGWIAGQSRLRCGIGTLSVCVETDSVSCGKRTTVSERDACRALSGRIAARAIETTMRLAIPFRCSLYRFIFFPRRDLDTG